MRHAYQSAPDTLPTHMAGSKGKNVTDLVPETDTPKSATPETGPPEVAVFIAINNRGHSYSEIPQVLQSLKYLKENNGIDRKLIVIKDPVDDNKYRTHMKAGERNKQQYDETAEITGLGAVNAARTSSWYDSRNKQEVGQVTVGQQPFQLGGYEAGKKGEDNSETWTAALVQLGLDQQKAADVAKMLFYHHYDEPESDVEGFYDMRSDYWNTVAYNEGVLELLHLVSVLNRAQEGEFVIKNLIVSGHHYLRSNIIFGAQDPKNEDESDFFDLNLLYSLSRVFPKAFANIESLNLAACATDLIGEPYESAEMEISDLIGMQMSSYNAETGTFDHTNSRTVFPNLNVYSNWENTCPASTSAYGYRGLAKAFTMGNIYNANLADAGTAIDNLKYEQIAKNMGKQADPDGGEDVPVVKGRGYLSTTEGNQQISSLFPDDYQYLSISSENKKEYYDIPELSQYLYKSAGAVHQLRTEDLQSYLNSLPAAGDRTDDQKLYAQQVVAELQWRACVIANLLLQMLIYDMSQGDGSLSKNIRAALQQVDDEGFENIKEQFKKAYGIGRAYGGSHREENFVMELTGQSTWASGMAQLPQSSEAMQQGLVALLQLGALQDASYQLGLYPDEQAAQISTVQAQLEGTPFELRERQEGEHLSVALYHNDLLIGTYLFYGVGQVPDEVTIGDLSASVWYTGTSSTALSPTGVLEHTAAYPPNADQLIGGDLTNWNIVSKIPGSDGATVFLSVEGAASWAEIWKTAFGQENRYYAFSVQTTESAIGAGFPAQLNLINHGIISKNHETGQWVIKDLLNSPNLLNVPSTAFDGLGRQPVSDEASFKSLKLLELGNFDLIDAFIYEGGDFNAGRLKKLMSVPNTTGISKRILKKSGTELTVENIGLMKESIQQIRKQ